ncbi:MAG: alanine racemase [Propionibacteriaceae bacterium]|jgi:alanine racemase|nr:alanine racemase [Propionibacteriaceae bacterium]
MAESETFARVELAALGRNLAAIRAHTNRPILLPVKANAYGHGLIPVARAAQENNWADWFGVATVAEGLSLRRAGVNRPILKLSPAAPADVDTAVAAGLRLAVATVAQVEAASAAAARAGVTANLHLKVDTGMRRVGVEPRGAAELAAAAEAADHVTLEGIFTHLAVSDTPAEDEFTDLQLERFATAVAAIFDRLGRRVPLVHAANSGAVLAHPDAWGDLVRPGILSYGYYPDPAALQTVTVEPVLSLISHLSAVKPIRRGETVSYGRTWAAPENTVIATIPVGYGDGYFRGLSNKSTVLIGGRRYPQVGRVCMDQFMVDLGPAASASPGDRVTLIGADGAERIGADELGGLVGTIPYEVLCAVAARVPRVYA